MVGVDTGQGPPLPVRPARLLGCPCSGAEGACLPVGLSGLSCLWPQSSPFRLWEESPPWACAGPAVVLRLVTSVQCSHSQ